MLERTHLDPLALVYEVMDRVVSRRSATTFAILSGMRPLMELSELSRPQQNVAEV
jgi:hypothetical protein